MRLGPLVALLSLALLLCLTVDSAEAGKQNAKKNRGVKGKITAVQQAGDVGFITIKTGDKKGAGEEVKVEITKLTKIERVTGKKGDRQTSAATLADLTQGTRVIVRRNAGSDVAINVEIVAGKKNKT